VVVLLASHVGGGLFFLWRLLASHVGGGIRGFRWRLCWLVTWVVVWFFGGGFAG
jgi:hypothetical protein